MSDPKSSASAPTASSSLADRSPITLQVGERRFVTIVDTLTQGSAYFSAMFSGRWAEQKQADGSFFIDADPEIFEHILRYLRHRVYPVFYDKLKGHDHAKYLAVLSQAKYFLIRQLERWIEQKPYLSLFRVETSAFLAKDVSGITGWRIPDPGVEVAYFPFMKTEKVYLCPRRIPKHRGEPKACGRACANAQGDAEDEYEDEQILNTLVIHKRTVFDQELCMEWD